MKLEITETVWRLLEKASARFDLEYEEIIRKSLVAFRRGHVAVRSPKMSMAPDRGPTRSISVSELPSFDSANAPPLNEILSAYLQYHLAKPERQEAPLVISEDLDNLFYFDSSNPASAYDLAAYLLMKS